MAQPPPYAQYPPQQYPPQQYPPQQYPPQQYPPQQYPPQQNQPYPPAQYRQAPPPQHAMTTVVTQPVVVQPGVVFKDFPVTMTNSRGQQITTRLDYRAGLLTWLALGFLCLFVGIFAFVVLFINDLKDVYHIDPTDGSVVGVYKRLS